MRIVMYILIFVSALAVGGCISAPKPAETPEDRAKSVFTQKGETYFELCESACSLPGLFGDEQTHARQIAKVEKVAGSVGETPPERVSEFEAANDFANRFNRAMLDLTKKKAAR